MRPFGSTERSVSRLARYLVLAWLAAAFHAGAADLSVNLRDQNGRPVGGAIVTVEAPGAGSTLPAPPAPVEKSIDQRNQAFVPDLETFRVGDRLVFRNNDNTRHHVYSFSKVKSFEFVLAKGENAAPIAFDKPGVIAVGCNIHDAMIAYLFVSDAPWIGRTDAGGNVRLEGLPAGAFLVSAWHQRQDPGAEQSPHTITIDPSVTSVEATLNLQLLPDPAEPGDRERSVY